MQTNVAYDDMRSSSCIISIMLTFNAVLNFCHPLAFLWICFLKLKYSLHYSGALWIFCNCLLDIVQFFVMTGFIFRNFKNNVLWKRLSLVNTISFYFLFAVQIGFMIVGSIKFNAWSYQPLHSFHSVYLVYFILCWCFLGMLVIVTLVCMLVEHCQRNVKDTEPLLNEDEGNGCCCCCRTHNDRECCGRCHHCCLGKELDSSRQRVNNSCCCDNCCPCCIDCCIDCCGDKNVPLPEGITVNDIVMVGPHHRVIYMPDPNAPVTLSQTQTVPISELAGVGNTDRHFVPAVFYSDVATATATVGVCGRSDA